MSSGANARRQNGKALYDSELIGHALSCQSISTASCSDAEAPEPDRLDHGSIRRASLYLSCRETAHTDFDFDLVWSCCEMLSITDLVDGEFVTGCLKMLSMLHSCEYPVDVTMMTLAVAIIYGADGSVRRAFDDGSARGLTLFCTHTFLAHTYLVDDCAFLETWSTYVFREMCDVIALNRHLVTFIRERKSGLRVDATAAAAAYTKLFGALERSTTDLQLVKEIANDTISRPGIAAPGCDS